MNDQQIKLPITFWIISVVALIWNLMGVFSFLGQTFMSEETLAQYPEEQQALYEAVPGWLTVVFAIAVFSGTLGSLSLLFRKAWAVPLFLVSLIAVVVQMAYNFFMTNAAEVFGPSSVVMSLLVILIALFLYYYAKKSQARSWLN